MKSVHPKSNIPVPMSQKGCIGSFKWDFQILVSSFKHEHCPKAKQKQTQKNDFFPGSYIK